MSWYYIPEGQTSPAQQTFFADSKATHNCEAASTFLRFTNSHETGNILFNYYKVYLHQSPTSFNSKPSKGIMGIAPNGEFWRYIINNTNWITGDDAAIFGLSYTPVSGAKNLIDVSKSDVWSSKSSFIVQGKKNAGKP